MHPIGSTSPKANSDDETQTAQAQRQLAVRAISQSEETPGPSTSAPRSRPRRHLETAFRTVSVASPTTGALGLDKNELQDVVRCCVQLTEYYFLHTSAQRRDEIREMYNSTDLRKKALSQSNLKEAVKFMALDFHNNGYKVEAICNGLMCSKTLFDFWREGYEYGGISFLMGTSIKHASLIAKSEIKLTEVQAIENSQLILVAEKIIFKCLQNQPEVAYKQIINEIQKDKDFLETRENIRKNREKRGDHTEISLNLKAVNYFISHCGLRRFSEALESEIVKSKIQATTPALFSSSQASASSTSTSASSSRLAGAFGIKRKASSSSEGASTSGSSAKKTLVFQPPQPSTSTEIQTPLSRLMANVGLLIAPENQDLDNNPIARCMDGLSIFKFYFSTDDERYPVTDGVLRANDETSSILRKKYFVMECDRRGMSPEDICQLFDLSIRQIIDLKWIR